MHIHEKRHVINGDLSW